MRERELFLEALDQPSYAVRELFLDQITADQPSLGQRVRSLVRLHDDFDTAPAPPDNLESAGPAVGDVIARTGVTYKLHQKLGEGGMGSVWAAEQSEPFRRRVAIKLIRDGVDSQVVGPRFEQERQALALMDHPNIASVFDAGMTDTGRPFIVMELVIGHPLTEFADRERLSLRERLALFVPICRAIQHAHQKGIIHRDIKPSNVLIGLYDGRPIPKVIDFGVAKAAGTRLIDRTIFTHIGLVVGTPHYMAPEQAELNNVDIDTRADIYSLGVILYELITGSTPLTTEQPTGGLLDLLRRVRETEPATPSVHLSTARELPAIAARRQAEPKRLSQLVRGELDWIVMRCLEKDRNRRYQTAEELATDVENHLSGQRVLAGPPTRRYRLAKFVRHHKTFVAVTLFSILALFIGSSVAIGLMLRARYAEHQAHEFATRSNHDRLAFEQEAAIARSVLRFMQDVLSQADSVRQSSDGRSPDPDLTVRTALERAASRIDSSFRDQPLTEAAVRFTIGRAFQSLGKSTDALQHLERCVEIRVEQLGRSHLETLAARQLLASTLAELGHHVRAEQEMRSVLSELPASETSLRRVARHAIANLTESAGRYPDAAAMLMELAGEYENEYGPAHGLTLTCRSRLADIDRKAGRFREADIGFREVLSHAQQFGEDHPLMISARANHIMVLRQTGTPQVALESAKDVVRQSEKRLGQTHPHTLAAKVNLAVIRLEMNDSATAITELSPLITDATTVLGPDHETTLSAQYNLAECLQIKAKWDEAESLFIHVIARRTSILGRSHPLTRSARVGLAGMYVARGEWSWAESHYRAVIDERLTNDPSHLNALNNLGVMLRRAKRYDDAEPILIDAFRLAEDQFGSIHSSTVLSFANMISLYEHQQKSEQILSLVNSRIRTVSQFSGTDAVLADLEAVAGRILLRMNQYPDAERHLRTAINLYGLANREDWKVGYAQSQLGTAISGQGKYEQAEPFLRAGHERMQTLSLQIPDSDRDALLRQSARRLSETLVKLGRTTDAETILNNAPRGTVPESKP